jgi:type VI secretion system protein ImpG
MDPRLLDSYERELLHIRQMAAEFAREFPRVAPRLGLTGLERGAECPDPHVERLLEGFAFLAARVQLKIDDEFPRFSQHLLSAVYPHYLPPTPSMAIVRLQPNLQEGALAGGFVVPRHTLMRSRLSRRQQTPCRFRTAHDVTLWPIEVDSAEYRPFVGDLPTAGVPGRRDARATLRLRLRCGGGLTFNQLALERLTLHLAGDPKIATRIHELLLARAAGLIVRPADEPGAAFEALPPRHLAPVGFEDEEALLPFGPDWFRTETGALPGGAASFGRRSFQGYRLLQEYFAFPQRFLFVEVSGLSRAVARTTGDHLELIVLLNRTDAALEGTVQAANFALFCTPAINLFPKRADRIHLSDETHEYHVVPDRVRPLDYEVHSVIDVAGAGADERRQAFLPLYGAHLRRDEGNAYYTVRREQRRLGSRQQQRGTRTKYVGSELYLALVDGEEGPYRSELKQLSVDTLCTNRDLPLLMPVGEGATDFTLETGAPVGAIWCLGRPTDPRASPAHGEVTWRLISHLSLNHLSLVDAEDGGGATTLRELLRLYAVFGEPSLTGQVEAVRRVVSQPIHRRLPGPGPVCFGRGLQITLSCDEALAEGFGVFLLGAVLERFFTKYVSINSFTETVLETVQRGEIMRWPAQPGRRLTL